MKSKFDRLSLGFLLGIIVPVITLIVVYFARFETYTFLRLSAHLLHFERCQPCSV
jgi:hypothetical protein